ncbi:transposase [Streptomyces sp. GbtcB7]|uniref:transposase n=1 Tax=Streptomyces sp. GbtcB7 TaxID=2824752 RepID=UPI001C30433A
MRRNSTRQTIASEGFGKTSFAINWGSRHATCPSGFTSRYWTEGLGHNDRPAIRIRFATETCAPCAVRDKCARSTRYGRQPRREPRRLRDHHAPPDLSPAEPIGGYLDQRRNMRP